MSRDRRRVAYMRPDEFEKAMRGVYNSEHGWKGQFADLIGVENSTITRWCNGTNLIPKWVAVLVWSLQHLDGVAEIEPEIFTPTSKDAVVAIQHNKRRRNRPTRNGKKL